MNIKKIYLTVFSALLLIACDSDELFDSNTKKEDMTPENNELFMLNIKYENSIYSVKCTNNEAGDLVFLDESFNDIYKNVISKNPGLTMLVLDNNTIEYFNSDKDMLKSMDFTLLSDAPEEIVNPKTRVGFTSTAGRATLWDDTGYRDRSISFDITYHNYFAWPRLSKYNNFNDKTSALKVWSFIPQNDSVTIDKGLIEYKYNIISSPYDPTLPGDTKYSTNDLRVVFMGYHNSDYSGVCFCCIPENTGQPVEFDNLKRLGWNDKISSVVLRLAIKDLYHTNY